MPRKPVSSANDPLKGCFFHSIENGKVVWQGTVLGRVSEEAYLVQLFDFLVGEPSVRRIVTLADMKPWLFYASADEMTHTYEYGAASKMKAR